MKTRLIAVAALMGVAVPLAAAEPPPLDKRVGTLETQMKAVQRKVFPGGDARYFTPEIAPETSAPPPEGTPASSPLADLTARVDALEQQQRTLTGQLEEAQNKLRQLDEAFTKYRGDTDFRLNAIEHPASAAPTPAAAPAGDAPPADASAPPPAASPPRAAAATKAPAKPVDKPAPALSVEEQWRAAYAFYTAKDYDKAEGAMTDFLTANPKAARASHAEYWLGRSYMAQDQFAPAAKAFLDGYKKYPNGERAPESLLWLGNALAALKKPKEACQAYDELPASYADKLTPALKSTLAKARKDAKCAA